MELAPRRIAVRAAWGLFILSLPLLLVTTNLHNLVNNKDLYTSAFEKYQVQETTGIDEADLPRVAEGFVQYFKSGEESFNPAVRIYGEAAPLFNDREVAHLRDVKGLIQLFERLWAISMFYFLAYFVFGLVRQRGAGRRQTVWGVFWGGVATYVILALAGLGALLDFDRVFTWFHLVGFSNDLWQLDPTRDRLIQLFPQDFFYTATLALAGLSALFATILMLASGAYLFLTRKKKPAPLPVPAGKKQRQQ